MRSQTVKKLRPKRKEGGGAKLPKTVKFKSRLMACKTQGGGALQLKIRGSGSIVGGWDSGWEKIFWGPSKILIWTIVRG